MKVKIKKVYESAKLPTKAHATDAGWDLYAITKSYDDCDNVVYGTGIAMEIPKGYVGLIFPRSSNAKKDLLLSNSVGCIDSGYRGEISAKFKITEKEATREYSLGDRIAQLIIIPYPEIEWELTTDLSDSDRGQGAYGSSGK